MDLLNHHSFLNDDLAATEATCTVRIPVDYSVNKKAAVVNDREGSNLDGEFLMSIQQLGSNFGCIPLTPIQLHQGSQKVWQNIPEVLQAHRMIRDSGIPIFLGLCIPV